MEEEKAEIEQSNEFDGFIEFLNKLASKIVYDGQVQCLYVLSNHHHLLYR